MICVIFLGNEDELIVIGIVCGIGAILIIMIVIVLIAYIRRRRQRYEHIRQIQ